ncbi:BT_3987 domain-containing protein [Proteiniphilum sp.]|uniref:BT_3987 domain-containing protein n=1 Tax=Proteiniphilum sp. TaxID=1926877 RepID=UPI002B200BBA|nr:DUF1735 domain-containing protein [Proteiniphilum sp.]MEA4917826.1 DUF1735 domain-containing protein [Proteiniphilum sp.]
MKKITYILLISLLLFACEDEIKYTEGSYFGLSETNVSFDSKAGEYTVRTVNLNGSLKATVISENSEWCSASSSGNTISIKVQENLFVKSRTAVVEITDGKDKINLMVRQARKYFTSVAPVKDLKATPGPNRITLTWTEPEEDNFSHVIITYLKKGEDIRVILDGGVTEYTIPELLNSDGEYTFNVQSIDKDNDAGDIVSIKGTAGKLVAFRFEKDIDTQWVPYYLRESDTYSTTLKVGSAEFDEGQKITVEVAIDESLLAAYNQKNGTSYAILPAGTYTLPENLTYNGTTNYQNYNIQLDIPAVGDQKIYALPLKIASTSSAEISEIMAYTVVIFYVDDLAGWYTVDRLSKNGEPASAYPASPQDRRRYIRRTGTTTWETGYLFRAYATSETRPAANDNSFQYISLDPATKQITIKQGSYPSNNHLNEFNITTNELHIEYHYPDWPGWWNHERMYSRSLKR